MTSSDKTAHHVVFLDRASLPIDDLDLSRYGEVTLWDNTREDEVLERARGATILISNKVAVRAAVLKQLKGLQLIAVPATGLNHLDLDVCQELGIEVRNCEGYADTGIAEHVMALILALRRNLVGFRKDLNQGLWSKSSSFSLFTRSVIDIRGQTLGIVGNGRLGKATAQLAQSMGMKVQLADRKGASTGRAAYRAFDEVLATSDVLSLHCPLTAETRHLIGAPELARMKPGALLINTSRGGLLDDQALLRALATQTIAGAGLDVLDVEPPPPDHPLLATDLPNLIVTPHVAWMSSQSLVQLKQQLFAHIEQFQASR